MYDNTYIITYRNTILLDGMRYLAYFLQGSDVLSLIPKVRIPVSIVLFVCYRITRKAFFSDGDHCLLLKVCLRLSATKCECEIKNQTGRRLFFVTLVRRKPQTTASDGRDHNTHSCGHSLAFCSSGLCRLGCCYLEYSSLETQV